MQNINHSQPQDTGLLEMSWSKSDAVTLQDSDAISLEFRIVFSSLLTCVPDLRLRKSRKIACNKLL